MGVSMGSAWALSGELCPGLPDPPSLLPARLRSWDEGVLSHSNLLRLKSEFYMEAHKNLRLNSASGTPGLLHGHLRKSLDFTSLSKLLTTKHTQRLHIKLWILLSFESRYYC